MKGVLKDTTLNANEILSIRKILTDTTLNGKRINAAEGHPPDISHAPGYLM